MYLSKLQLNRDSSISKSLKYLILVSLALFFVTKESNAQEIRLSGSLLAVGGSAHPYLGASIGFESGIGTHFTMVFDANIAPDEIGTWLSYKPSVLYYFKKDRTGLFMGPSVAYHHLKEPKGEDLYHEGAFAVGLDLGFKSRISEKIAWHITLAPEITWGPWNGSLAAIMTQTGVTFKL